VRRRIETVHCSSSPVRFVALLRIATNPGDELSWFRLLQLLEGVGPTTARRLCSDLVRDEPSLALLPSRWAEADVPAPAREPGLRLPEALAADGKPSRFLTEQLQSLSDVVRIDDLELVPVGRARDRARL
jgi:hypothetical protein